MLQNIRCSHSQNVKNQYFTCSWSIKPFLDLSRLSIYAFSIPEIIFLKKTYLQPMGGAILVRYYKVDFYTFMCRNALRCGWSYLYTNYPLSLWIMIVSFLLHVTPVLSFIYIRSFGKLIAVSFVLTSECHLIKFYTPNFLYMTYFKSLILSINIVFVSNIL